MTVLNSRQQRRSARPDPQVLLDLQARLVLPVKQVQQVQLDRVVQTGTLAVTVLLAQQVSQAQLD